MQKLASFESPKFRSGGGARSCPGRIRVPAPAAPPPACNELDGTCLLGAGQSSVESCGPWQDLKGSSKRSPLGTRLSSEPAVPGQDPRERTPGACSGEGARAVASRKARAHLLYLHAYPGLVRERVSPCRAVWRSGTPGSP